MNEFFKSLSFGKVGENQTTAMLKKRGWEVEDVSEQRLSYDLIAIKNQTKLKIEVKHQKCVASEKICLELKQVNKDGWFFKLDADKIIFTYQQLFIVLDVEDLKDYYNNNVQNIQKIITNEGKTICFIEIQKLRKYQSFQTIEE